MGAMQNYGGVKAAERETDYSKRMEGIDKEHRADESICSNSKTNLVTIPIFSIMDGTVLVSIFNDCFVESAFMIFVMSFGIAVVLNFLPVLIAKFAHQAIYKTKRQALTMMIICMTGFFLIFGGTVILRFAYSDMYENDAQSMQLENTVSNETTTETEAEADENSKNKSIAVVILLSLSPLVTSIIGFGIAFISDDEVRKRFEYYERRDIELDEAISDLEAAIETMNSDVDRDMGLDEESMNAAIEEIIARADTLKALARHYLAEYLADPTATSKLSAEMRLGNESEGPVENVAVKEDNDAPFRAENVA